MKAKQIKVFRCGKTFIKRGRPPIKILAIDGKYAMVQVQTTPESFPFVYTLELFKDVYGTYNLLE